MVLTILKNISQWEGLSHILWKIKHVWNHQPASNASKNLLKHVRNSPCQLTISSNSCIARSTWKPAEFGALPSAAMEETHQKMVGIPTWTKKHGDLFSGNILKSTSWMAIVQSPILVAPPFHGPTYVLKISTKLWFLEGVSVEQGFYMDSQWIISTKYAWNLRKSLGVFDLKQIKSTISTT